MVSTRVARSSRPGSTNLEVVKLVEPTCDEGAGRVETMVRVSGILWSGLLVGCRVVSTRVARSSRPGSTSFGGGARDPAQPASARSALLPSSGPLSAFLVHETRVRNGSTLCGDVEPSSFRDSCTGSTVVNTNPAASVIRAREGRGEGGRALGSGGFDSGRSFVAARLNQLGRSEAG